MEGLGPRPPNAFGTAHLDRVAQHRADPDWVARQLDAASTRVLLMWRSKVLLAAGHAPALLPAGAPLLAALPAGEPLLLGRAAGGSMFVVDLDPADESVPDLCRAYGEFQGVRRAAAVLSRDDAGTVAYARALTRWHRIHGFCPSCGAPTISVQAGHARQCSREGCGAQHFPRLDPAVIVLVTNGERCLLGRQPAWEPGFYSTLAGFVEAGESVEDAVAREVLEESGVAVRDVRYHSSQPWPFPSSLMLGFTATGGDEAVRTQGGELEDVRWFTRDALGAGLASGALRVPPPMSIAHRLLADWFEVAGTRLDDLPGARPA